MMKRDKPGIHAKPAAMPTVTVVILTLLLLSFGAVSQIQSYDVSMDKIMVDDGVPNATVHSMAKDKSGFLWFATPMAVTRYDGHQFRSFGKNAAGTTSSAVTNPDNIFIDSQQRLWISSVAEGLLLYDRNMQLIAHFRHQQDDPASIGSDRVLVVFEDNQGDIWIGTNGGGLAHYQPRSQSFVNYRFDAQDNTSLSHNQVWSIAQTGQSQIWLATSDGLSRMDKKRPGKFTRLQHEPALATFVANVSVRSLLTGSNGDLWIGTRFSVGRFNTRTHKFRTILATENRGVASVTRMLKDHLGGIWIGTQRGLFRYDAKGNHLTPLAGEDHFRLLPHNDIRDMLFDNTGMLWVATRYAGLIKVNLRTNRFSYYATGRDGAQTSPSDDKVYALHADKQGFLWLGVAAGLRRMDMQSRAMTTFNLPSMAAQAPGTAQVRAITESPSGKLWVGGPFGLMSLNSERQHFVDETAILANLESRQVTSLLMDSQGILWVGTAHEGLLRVDRHGEIRHYQSDSDSEVVNGLGTGAIEVLFEDHQGRLWIGSKDRVNRLDADGKQFMRYPVDNHQNGSVSDNQVNVIYQTRDGQMWFGTTKYLQRLDEISGRFAYFGVKEGLADGHINSMVEDHFGDLWLSTDNGLSQFKRRPALFFNVNAYRGLQSNRFLLRSVAKSDNGVLYFGGNGGVHEISPSLAKIGNHQPPVVITGVEADDLPVARVVFGPSKPLVLSHQSHRVTFHFSLLDFQAENKHDYSWKLEGVDEDWREPGEFRSASYKDLAPGEYFFSVRGSDNFAQWYSQSHKIQLIISPPWWHLLWAKIAAASLLLLLLYSLRRWRLLTAAGQEKLLEVGVGLRTSELEQQHDELLTTLQLVNERSRILEETNEELTRTLDATAIHQEQLMEQHKMSALTDIVSGISREINTPIGLGITATTLMQDRMAELKRAFDKNKLSATQLSRFLEEGEENFAMIYRNLNRAAEMIRKFKQMSLEQSNAEIRTFGIHQLINEVLFSLQANLKQTGHLIKVFCDESVMIKSNPVIITRILTNLIKNSLVHAFEDIDKGMMSIDVKIADNQCQLIYRDNGVGVAEEIGEQIFQPFSPGKDNESNSGMGMHLVYNLVTRGLEGSIVMEQENEQGVQFTLTFPVNDMVRIL